MNSSWQLVTYDPEYWDHDLSIYVENDGEFDFCMSFLFQYKIINDMRTYGFGLTYGCNDAIMKTESLGFCTHSVWWWTCLIDPPYNIVYWAVDDAS